MSDAPASSAARDISPGLPVDAYLAELDAFIAVHDPLQQDRVIPAIALGTVSYQVVQRVALERYHLEKWMTPEVAILVANAPDAYAFTMEDSRHYHHWAQTFADETGYSRDPNHLQTAVDLCHQLGLTDDDIRAYTPLPDTIAMTFTTAYYVRRSYEEGLAVLGYAGERVAGGGRLARTLHEGLARHYGVKPGSSDVQASTYPRPADLFRLVATNRAVQDRCREAIRNCLLVAETRVRAMNRWVE